MITIRDDEKPTAAEIQAAEDALDAIYKKGTAASIEAAHSNEAPNPVPEKKTLVSIHDDDQEPTAEQEAEYEDARNAFATDRDNKAKVLALAHASAHSPNLLLQVHSSVPDMTNEEYDILQQGNALAEITSHSNKVPSPIKEPVDHRLDINVDRFDGDYSYVRMANRDTS